MSNIDESSGNTIMRQLYRNNRTALDRYQFSLLIAPLVEQDNVLTICGYQVKYFNKTLYPLVGHPVSGSFHWSLHIVRYKMNGKWFYTKATAALTDSGSTDLLLP